MNQTRILKRVKGGGSSLIMVSGHEALSRVTWADNHIIQTRALEQTVLMVDTKTQLSHRKAETFF